MRAIAWLTGASFALAAALLCALGSPTPVGAQSDEPNDSALAAVQTLTGEYDPGDHVALTITVVADQLIDGHVEIRPASGSLSVRRDVQVAGGATEEIHVLVPTNQASDARFAVELFDDGESVDLDSVSFTHDAAADVLGVLPLLLARTSDPPERVSLDGDVRRVRVAPLPVELLSLGAPSISQLDTVAATSADMAALDLPALDALLTWIDAGGHLVLDDADDLSALPSRWQPAAAGYALAGQGEIRVVDGALSAGEWASAVQPTPLSSIDSPMGSGVDFVLDPRITLAQRAGVSLPNLTVIVAILGGYVVLLGPVLYLVLRRARRLTAAWVVIPAVAVLLAGGLTVVGANWRTSGRPTSSTVLEVRPGGGYAHADLLVFSRSGGTASVSLPERWMSGDQSELAMFGGAPSAARTVVSDDRGERVEARLETGQIAVFNVEGAQPAEALSVDAWVAGDGQVSGTITNSTTVALRAVGVFAGGKGVRIGDIPAGAVAEFTVRGIPDVPDVFSSALGSVWPDPRFGFPARDEDLADDGVDLGIWTSFSSRVGERLYPSGLVRVAGWSDELPSALSGDVTFRNNTLVTAVAPIMSGAGPLRPPAVRVAFTETAFDPRTGQPSDPVVRFVVPPDTAEQELELTIPRGIVDVELLDAEGEWQEQKITDRVVAVPTDAMRSGSLLVRFAMDMSQPVDVSFLRPTLQGVEP